MSLSRLCFSLLSLSCESQSRLCVYLPIYFMSLCLSLSSVMSLSGLRSVYLSMFPLLFHPLSLQSVMYLFIPSPSVYHVLVWVSVCVTSHLICPHVLMPVSLFSFTSSVFPGVFHLPNYVVSLSLQCHIAVIHPPIHCISP